MFRKSGFNVFLLLGIALFFHAFSARAKEKRWTHFGLRPLGMGNAYVAVADDFNALFYNPAGLGRIKDFDGELFNPTLEWANRTLKFIDSLLDLSSSNLESTSEILDMLKDQAGKNHHMAAYLTPHFIAKNWGFGLGLTLPFSMVNHNELRLDLDTSMQIIAPISFAMNFFDKRLSVGTSVKMLSKIGIDQSFALDSISALTDDGALDDLVLAGSAYGVDLGLLFTPISAMEPTLGVSVVDFGGTAYTKLDSLGTAKPRAPKMRLPSVNTGVSFKPIKTDRMYLLAAVDAHMINRPIHYSHKFNIGLEWGYSEIIKIQTGLKEGYLTGGLQFDVGLLNIRFATYAVDHAPIVGTHENLVERRYAFQFKLLI